MYEIYCRLKHSEMGDFKSKEEAKEKTEVILDIEEIPFVS
jgi:hypothetical protein